MPWFSTQIPEAYASVTVDLLKWSDYQNHHRQRGFWVLFNRLIRYVACISSSITEDGLSIVALVTWGGCSHYSNLGWYPFIFCVNIKRCLSWKESTLHVYIMVLMLFPCTTKQVLFAVSKTTRPVRCNVAITWGTYQSCISICKRTCFWIGLYAL